jgi:DNA-binding NarL/FixJ family response regulator
MAGAAGYLLKEVTGTNLVGAVRQLAAGESLLDPKMTATVLERLRHPAEEDEDPRYKSLTDQERRILDLIAEGKTNRQIAEQMYLAEKTVKNYVSGLLRKLGMERRTEAAVYAVERTQRQRKK